MTHDNSIDFQPHPVDLSEKLSSNSNSVNSISHPQSNLKITGNKNLKVFHDKSAHGTLIEKGNINQPTANKAKVSGLHVKNQVTDSSFIPHTITRNEVSSQVFDLLNKTPMGLSEVSDVLMDLHTLQKMYRDDLSRLDEILVDKNSPKRVKLNNNIRALEDKIANLKNFEAAHPFSPDNLKDAVHLRHNVMQGVLDSLIQSDVLRNIPDVQKKIQIIKQQLDNLKKEQLSATDPKILMHYISDLNKVLLKMIQCEFSKEEFSLIPKGLLKSLITAKSLEALSDEKRWPILEKSLYLSNPDQNSIVKYNTQVTPAFKLQTVKDGTTYSIAGLPIGGVPSGNTTGEHAINLNYRTLTNEKGIPIYKAFRHGVHSAFKSQDLDKREALNLQRVRETVAAIVLKDEKAMHQLSQGIGDESTNPIILTPIWSISLQTPSLPAKLIGELKVPLATMLEEYKLINEQTEAWKNFTENPKTDTNGNNYIILKTVDADGIEKERKIYIQTEVLSFDFGVNALAFGIFGNKVGWYDAEKANQHTFEKLFGLEKAEKLSTDFTHLSGSIGESIKNLQAAHAQTAKALKFKTQEFMKLTKGNALSPERAAQGNLLQQEKTVLQQNLDSLEKKLKQVNVLLPQIIDIYNSKSFRSGKDPYKMAARMIVLGNILNQNIAFNCKSGKDRTSQADSESAYLLSYWELHGSFPEPNAYLSADERITYQQFIINMGNFEIQKANTSVAGYKFDFMTKYVSNLIDRIGAEDEVIGASSAIDF